MSAPYSPTLGELHGIDQDFQGFQLCRARMWNITTSQTVAYGEAPGDGAIAYNAVNCAKRLKFYDTQVTADVIVPRLDYTETVSAPWAFSYNSGSPFTVTSTTKVDNLNADLLDGYNTSATAVQDKIPVYYTSGRLLVGTPVAGGDAVTKDYADAMGAGLNIAPLGPVHAATTASIADLSNATVTHDGVVLTAGQYLLVKDNASPDGVVAVSAKYNGIYTVGTVSAGSAPLTRRTDSDSTAELDREYTFVSDGTVNQGSSWVQTTNDPVIGTDNIVWAKFFQATAQNPGNGIDITGNIISVLVSASTTYTAGGILYHGSTSTISSVALAGVVQGNGASAPTAVTGTQYGLAYWPTTTTLGTTGAGTATTILHGNAAGAPTWSAVSLTADITGILGVGNGGSGVATFTAGVIISPGTTTALSSVTGTSGKLVKWGTNTLLDSLVSESGTTVTVGGSLTVTGTTTLATTLTGSLKSVSGVVSAVTGAADRVTFWSDANTLSSNAGFTYDGSTLALSVSSGNLFITTANSAAAGVSQLRLNNDATSQFVFRIYGSTATGTNFGINHTSMSLIGTDETAGPLVIGTFGNASLVFGVNNTEKWRITSTAGVFQSNGAQTIQTSTGTLTLATAAGNGDVLLLPQGNGVVGINTSAPTGKLNVLGTTEQLRLSYDATHVTSFTVGSTGAVTIAAQSGTSVSITSHLLPTTDATYNLGSATKQWANLYLSSNVTIGGLAIAAGIVINNASGVLATDPLGSANIIPKYDATGLASSLLSDNGSTLTYNSKTVARGYAVNLTSISTNTFTVTHNLGTLDVIVQIVSISTGQTWEVSVIRTSVNAVTVTFGYAPADNVYRCLVTAVS